MLQSSCRGSWLLPYLYHRHGRLKCSMIICTPSYPGIWFNPSVLLFQYPMIICCVYPFQQPLIQYLLCLHSMPHTGVRCEIWLCKPGNIWKRNKYVLSITLVHFRFENYVPVVHVYFLLSLQYPSPIVQVFRMPMCKLETSDRRPEGVNSVSIQFLRYLTSQLCINFSESSVLQKLLLKSVVVNMTNTFLTIKIWWVILMAFWVNWKRWLETPLTHKNYLEKFLWYVSLTPFDAQFGYDLLYRLPMIRARNMCYTMWLHV